MTTATLTSNQYYGAINRRFARRSALLRKLGWTYAIVQLRPADRKSPTIGIWTRGRGFSTDCITACTVSAATNRVFRDEIARYRFRSF